MPDNFGINGIGHAAVEQRGKTLQIANESADQAIRNVSGKQPLIRSL